MNTKLFDFTEKISAEQIAEAGQLIRDGEIVVFPTETVYGLGADAFNPTAVSKIFEAKGRPGDNPLIVHIAHPEEAQKCVKTIPEKAKKLMDAYWPGPLTLIMAKQESVPEVVTAGLQTVALRLPASETAREFIASAGVPIAAPSANISGRPSPTRGEHVIEDMLDKAAAIIIRDDVRIGLESTVMDMTTEPPTMLRPGGVTVADVEAVIGKINVSPNITANIIPEKVKSPGMKYKHYAPRGEVVIVKGTDQEKTEKISREIVRLKAQNETPIGILASEELIDTAFDTADEALIIIPLGSRKNPLEMSQQLFDCLRQFDALNVAHIFAEDIEINNDTLALINRLYKSAGYRFI